MVRRGIQLTQKSIPKNLLFLIQDPKHSSILCRGILLDNDILWLKSPPKSPDLNPIEMVWSDMKRYVRSQFCKTDLEVVDAIEDYRLTLTPEKCQAFIKKLKQVL